MARELIRSHLAPFFAFVLRTLPTHRLRKRFAKHVGPYFFGSVAKTAYGLKMVCNWYDNANRIIFEGRFGVVEDFIFELPPHALFIDIGANQGGTSIMASRVLAEGGGQVMAYEPNPVALGLMKENIVLNGCENVHVFEQGVAPFRKELRIDNSDRENSGSAHVSDDGVVVVMGPICLRDVQSVLGDSPVFVKIDTEGYEMEVLTGISELLSENIIQKLVVEIDRENLENFGSSPEMVYAYLSNFGFSPKRGLSVGHYDEVFSA